MRFGLYVPTINEFADPDALVELALAAERAGWDGVFLFDHVAWATAAGPARVIDTWMTLAAAAEETSAITLGSMVTPVARRRPQKLARETATVDRLSGGRLVLGAGLGFPPEMEFANFGDEADARVRAARLDEGLEVLARLWSGDPVEFEGAHVKAKTEGFLPRPVQSPRIPIWIGVGQPKPDSDWRPQTGPIARAARWDGVFPLHSEWPAVALPPQAFADLKAQIDALRTDDRTQDMVFADSSARLPDHAAVADYEAVGVTWWFSAFGVEDPLAAASELAATPPR